MMLLSNMVDFNIKLSPVDGPSYSKERRFQEVCYALIKASPKYFTLQNSDYYADYGKFVHIKGTLDMDNEKEMIEELKQILAGLIKEGHGTITAFEYGKGNKSFPISFEGFETEEEREL